MQGNLKSDFHYILTVFLLMILLIGVGCESSTSTKQLTNDDSIQPLVEPDYSFPYHLKKASQIHFLPNKLVEISGLSLSLDSTQLVCVNDEIGRVFSIDKKSGKLLSSFEFAENGDYEGLELVDGKYYVVKNNGTIYTYDPITKKTRIENTFLTAANDVEGLSYWSKRHRLLIACKGSPSGKNNYKKAKAIYDFDLKENKLKKKPMFLISKKKIKAFINAKKGTGFFEKLGQQSQLKDALNFSPSGIAVHPISQNIYMLSAVGNTLFVVNEKGDILHIEFLNTMNFRKPEGITFDKNGLLYISNEGKKGNANLMSFNYNKAS